MDTARRRLFQRLSGPVDVDVVGARARPQTTLSLTAAPPPTASKSPGWRSETGFDHVDPHPLQHLGDADFLSLVMDAPGLCSPSRRWCRR